jgi:hypothetical protein
MELGLLLVELYFSESSKLVVFKAIISNTYGKLFENIVYKINRFEDLNLRHIKLCRFAMLEVVNIKTHKPLQGFCKMKSNRCYGRLI